MRLVSHGVVVGLLGVGALAIACNGGPGIPQAVVASSVQPAQTGANVGKGCNSPEQFIYVPLQPLVPCGEPNPTDSTSPGPDTNCEKNITVNGTADYVVTCSVIPADNGNYNVSLQAQITGGTAPGTFTVTGLFNPRSRETMDDAGTPNMDMTQVIPNITVDFLDATKHLRETDCTARYLEVSDGDPSPTALPSQADTCAASGCNDNSSGGRIWASVYCPAPTNLLEGQKPGNSGCMMSATFRFENCSIQM